MVCIRVRFAVQLLFYVLADVCVYGCFFVCVCVCVCVRACVLGYVRNIFPLNRLNSSAISTVFVIIDTCWRLCYALAVYLCQVLAGG